MAELKQIGTKNKLDGGLSFKVSRFKEQIKRTTPHKHDEYYELIFLHEGEGFHTVETEKFLVSPPECYFLKPGQLHFWQFTAIPKGFVVLFKDTEFDQLEEPDLVAMCNQLVSLTRLPIPARLYPSAVLTEMVIEFGQHSLYSQTILHGLLRALFGKVLNLSHSDSLPTGQPTSLFERFRQLLVRECPHLRKVNEFANLLNTSPQNLNAICRKQTGQSASAIISAQLMLEAKRYILHTDNTISEIAELLSFSDASNFVKFFRKAEGTTPAQFREKYFQ
ncbi:MAG: helix-turn-helix domain-containing protein [Mangrovibacterium sp.]